MRGPASTRTERCPALPLTRAPTREEATTPTVSSSTFLLRGRPKLPPQSIGNVQRLVFRAILKLPSSALCFRESPRMAHGTREELLRASEAGRAEIARVAAHVSLCPSCRSLAESLLKDLTQSASCEVPLKTLLELAAFEKETAVEQLLARAELADLRRLTRGAQKERII